MRVLSGTARGRRLKTQEGTNIRPTSDRVKESIFDIIQFNVPGANILDLFAGSGALGIEALSRGAGFVTFVDQSPEAVKVIKENIKACGFEGGFTVKKSGFAEFLKGYTGSPFDLVFLDPPYGQAKVAEAMDLLRGCERMSERGIIIAESEAELLPPEKSGGIYLHKTYRYGRTTINLYRREEAK